MTRDLVAERAAHLHPGREPSDPPSPSPPSHASIPAESFGRRYGWIVTAIVGAFGIGVTLSTLVFAWQVVALREQVHGLAVEIRSLRHEVELGFRSEEITHGTLGQRIATLEGAMAKTPGVSTNLNVAAHEPRGGK